MQANCVLIADDEPLTRWAVARRIEEIGGHAVEAASRSELERQFLLARPRVVIAACTIAGENISDIFHTYAGETPVVPLILLCEEDQIDRTREDFPDALVFEKPFGLETIAETVRRFLVAGDAEKAG